MSMEAPGPFPRWVQASHGSTILQGPKPQALVLSELSDLKSWKELSEEPRDCLGKKETNSSHRADSCRPGRRR